MDCNEHLKVNLSWVIDTVNDNCDNDEEQSEVAMDCNGGSRKV